MPYIVQRHRPALTPEAISYAESVGELTFQIQQVIKEYMKGQGCENPKSLENVSYTMISEVLFALDGASRDFWDRIGRPYEELKRQENGDVW